MIFIAPLGWLLSVFVKSFNEIGVSAKRLYHKLPTIHLKPFFTYPQMSSPSMFEWPNFSSQNRAHSVTSTRNHSVNRLIFMLCFTTYSCMIASLALDGESRWSLIRLFLSRWLLRCLIAVDLWCAAYQLVSEVVVKLTISTVPVALSPHWNFHLFSSYGLPKST